MVTTGQLGTRTGTVASFNDDRGLGVIDSDGQAFGFHCTAIASGARTIEAGTAVSFDVIAGRAGRWEAWSVSPTG